MRWTLPSDRVPEAWFNVAPHLPEPLDPPLAPRRPASPSAPTTWPRCSRWRSSARR